ncbi:hypothetical protein ON010_g12621 [Phytophthora cinnamomi]|nr:hypothetical protein ON010_g12621 [Phytophthora cinnamomi]
MCERSSHPVCIACLLTAPIRLVELVENNAATTLETAGALLAWFKRFGLVTMWVSDRSAHFKANEIDALRKALGSTHHFVTACCPLANGSVEVVNRELLRWLKSLPSEMKLQQQEWPVVLPIVQAALNHILSDRLGGVAPVSAFTVSGAIGNYRAACKGFVGSRVPEAVEYCADQAGPGSQGPQERFRRRVHGSMVDCHAGFVISLRNHLAGGGGGGEAIDCPGSSAPYRFPAGSGHALPETPHDDEDIFAV